MISWKVILAIIAFVVAVLAIGTYGETQEPGCLFSFYNDTEEMQIYLLYWVNPPWKDFKGPVSIAGGELVPGKGNVMPEPFPSGKYMIGWRPWKDADKWEWKPISVSAHIAEIEFRPSGWIVRRSL